MPHPALLATRYARRPLLLEPSAARELLAHLAASDPRGMRNESRFEAVLRAVGLRRDRPAAMDDDYDPEEAEARRQANLRRAQAYSPLWAQQAFGDPQDEGFCWSLYAGCALMNVNTALDAQGEYYCGEWYHGYDTIMAALRETDADSRVQGRFIRMESPGGVVTGGLAALSDYMRASRAQAGGKPIHVFADMACSAAYHLAAQADRISASPVGLVGSIGAVIIHYDLSQALQKEGMVVTPIQFGAQKTAGAWWETLGPDAKADLQAEVDQCGRDFVAAVAAGRPQLTPEALVATEARVFMAAHDDPARSGLALGFVDAVETEEQAFQALLDRVSASSASAPAIGPAVLAATGSRGGPTLPQETPMAAGHTHKGPRAALASLLGGAARPAAAAAAAQASAQAAPQAATPDNPVTDPDDGMAICETCNGTGEDNGATCPECDGEGQVEVTEGERTASAPAPAPAAASDNAAQAIAASAEADAHPHLAMAAIKEGLSLSQFKAMAAVQGSSSAEAAIDRRMKGAQRLRADTPAAAGDKSAFGAALVADAKSKREKSGK